jgi:glutamyl-tRNA synthetase
MPYIYNRKWRDAKDLEIPKNSKPVVRFKSKISGNSIVKDLVQGEINISNSTIEDFVILRKDNSPTYQLSAVVDDHLMKITHVIRGDDHKINTFKQKQIYEAMKWKLPDFAHIPLIHSVEGKKLSKRDNASTISDYIKIGILPDALRNYLLRLGWSYKDKEIFTLKESIQYFNLTGIGKSPSKLDMDRILSINEHYIKNLNEKELYENLTVYAEKFKKKIENKYENNLLNSIHFLKNKAKTLEDIYKNSLYIMNENIKIVDHDKSLLDKLSKKIINEFLIEYEKIQEINKENLEKIIKKLISAHNINFKSIGQPLRIVLTGSKFGPGIYDILLSLNKEEVIKRLKIII